MRYVPGDQRAVSEAQLGTDFKQYAPTPSNTSVPSNSSVPQFVPRNNASEYLISWRMSSQAYQTLFKGFDMLSTLDGAALAYAARDSAAPVVSIPFAAPLGEGTALSVAWPFYNQNPFMYRTVAARRANFKGEGFVPLFFPNNV